MPACLPRAFVPLLRAATCVPTPWRVDHYLQVVVVVYATLACTTDAAVLARLLRARAVQNGRPWCRCNVRGPSVAVGSVRRPLHSSDKEPSVPAARAGRRGASRGRGRLRSRARSSAAGRRSSWERSRLPYRYSVLSTNVPVLDSSRMPYNERLVWFDVQFSIGEPIRNQ